MSHLQDHSNCETTNWEAKAQECWAIVIVDVDGVDFPMHIEDYFEDMSDDWTALKIYSRDNRPDWKAACQAVGIFE